MHASSPHEYLMNINYAREVYNRLIRTVRACCRLVCRELEAAFDTDRDPIDL